MKNAPPSISRDLLISFLITTIIICLYIIELELINNHINIDKNIINLFGAITTISGLMSKQYLLKENISYLYKWKKIHNLISLIRQSENYHEYQNFEIIINKTIKYIKYIETEIKIIPTIPPLLVFLYGAAIVCEMDYNISATALSLMIFLTTYLSFATITSNNIAIEIYRTDELISELNKIALDITNEI